MGNNFKSIILIVLDVYSNHSKSCESPVGISNSANIVSIGDSQFKTRYIHKALRTEQQFN